MSSPSRRSACRSPVTAAAAPSILRLTRAARCGGTCRGWCPHSLVADIDPDRQALDANRCRSIELELQQADAEILAHLCNAGQQPQSVRLETAQSGDRRGDAARVPAVGRVKGPLLLLHRRRDRRSCDNARQHRWEGGRPTQNASWRFAISKIRPGFARHSSRPSMTQARIAHAEIRRDCMLLILNDLYWRRGWGSDCCWVLTTKNIREFTFLTIR
jgi:hypothetical protein